MKARKKPVEIEYMQLPALGIAPSKELLDFLYCMQENWSSERDGTLAIHTLEGVLTANPRDYIIRGVKGEYYLCKPDIFEMTYDKLD